MIFETAVVISMMVMSAALGLNMYRMALGPHTLDRAVALDTMYINAIGMIVLLGMWLDSVLYFEAALFIAMMGFVGTVAVSKYALRGDIIE